MENEEVIEGQPCPMCHKNSLTLRERAMDVPYFGQVFMFSMQCTECKYFKSDVEPAEPTNPSKITLEIESEEDMKVRVVKSSEATVKIPYITTIEPGAASQGYVSNVEGIFNRIKHQIEELRDSAEEKEDRKKAKNLLKKIYNISIGAEKSKIIIEDPSGNSAIVSDKAKVEKLKVKK